MDSRLRGNDDAGCALEISGSSAIRHELPPFGIGQRLWNENSRGQASTGHAPGCFLGVLRSECACPGSGRAIQSAGRNGWDETSRRERRGACVRRADGTTATIANLPDGLGLCEWEQGIGNLVHVTGLPALAASILGERYFSPEEPITEGMPIPVLPPESA
jgi:hypothetical protein